MLRVQSPPRLFLFATGLGVLADFLFYGRSVGISIPLFIALLIGSLFVLGRMESVRLAPRNLWLLVPLFFFAVMIFVRANPFLTVLNFLAVIGLLLLFAFFFAADNIDRLGLIGYPVVIILSTVHSLVQAAPVFGTTARKVTAERGQVRASYPFIRGLLVAIPVLIVFTALLSSADLIFAGYVAEIFKIDFLTKLPELVWRFILIMTLAWVVCGGLVYALQRRRGTTEHSGQTDLPGTLVPDRIMGFVEGMTVLVLVDLLFLAFAWVQFAYLFNGHAASTMNYEQYRYYVHRGFGELLVVSVLTMCLILGLRWIARHESLTQERLFNLASTIMIGLVMVILVSAMQRMLVWENVEFYISTQIRLYVRSFIVWLGISFVWLFITLWSRQDKFAIGAFIAIIGFLVTVNVLNPDADVAQYNIAKYSTTQSDLSFRYLSNLSEDAVPVLVASLDTTSGEVQRRIRLDLQKRLESMERDGRWQGWQSFHLSRKQAYDMLVQRRAPDGTIK